MIARFGARDSRAGQRIDRCLSGCCAASSASKRCWPRAAWPLRCVAPSVLVGALSTAIAMMAAVGIMVGSFRQTVQLWMDDRLKADLFLRPAGDPPPTAIRPSIRASPTRIAALPGVAGVDRFRATKSATRECRRRSARRHAQRSHALAQSPFLSGAPPSVWSSPAPRPRQRHRQRAFRQQASRASRRHDYSAAWGTARALPRHRRFLRLRQREGLHRHGPLHSAEVSARPRAVEHRRVSVAAALDVEPSRREVEQVAAGRKC